MLFESLATGGEALPALTRKCIPILAAQPRQAGVPALPTDRHVPGPFPVPGARSPPKHFHYQQPRPCWPFPVTHHHHHHQHHQHHHHRLTLTG